MFEAHIGVWIHNGDHTMVYTCVGARAVDEERIGIVDSDSIGWRVVEDGVDGMKR